jgi:hypothetical protein
VITPGTLRTEFSVLSALVGRAAAAYTPDRWGTRSPCGQGSAMPPSDLPSGKPTGRAAPPPPAPAQHPISWRAAVGLLTALVLLAGGGAWLERGPLLAWLYLRELARAGEGDRAAWVERVAALDAVALPGLLDCLVHDDARACGNARAALARVAERWGPDDRRRGDLAARLVEAFPRLSNPGKESALALEGAWLGAGGGLPPALTPAVAALLVQAARLPDAALHQQALELVPTLLQSPAHAEVLANCRELVQACLKDAAAPNRARAARLAGFPEFGLLEPAMALLSDPAVEVRREAMLAARSAPESVIKTESLLHWLHDPDEDVRRVCEAVLRGRNLSEQHLKLGRLLTDERPSVRLEVLSYLRSDTDLEPGVWLRLLSIDPEPAVRVAAVRAAVADSRVDLSDRLEQMVQSDPSPTVCRLARYYLSCQQQRNLSSPSSRGNR